MSTATITQTFRLGDEITVNSDRFPGVYVITKVPRNAREVNYVCKPRGDVTGRGVRARASMLTAHASGTPAPAVVFVPYLPTPPAGTAVTVTGRRHIVDGEMYVVVGDSRARNTVRLARFGGDGFVHSSVPIASLTIVDPATLVRR